MLSSLQEDGWHCILLCFAHFRARCEPVGTHGKIPIVVENHPRLLSGREKRLMNTYDENSKIFLGSLQVHVGFLPVLKQIQKLRAYLLQEDHCRKTSKQQPENEFVCDCVKRSKIPSRKRSNLCKLFYQVYC